MEVEEWSAWIAAVRTADECSSDVGSIFFIFVVFSSGTMGLSGCETVHLNVDFKQFL